MDDKPEDLKKTATIIQKRSSNDSFREDIDAMQDGRELSPDELKVIKQRELWRQIVEIIKVISEFGKIVIMLWLR